MTQAFDLPLYGLALLRNGLKYDYCFQESLASLHQVCPRVVMALGDSEDATAEAIARLNYVCSIPTVWDPKLRQGGQILSQQTNIALQGAREMARSCGSDHWETAWGVYLQCDEVIHEDDVALLQKDLIQAHTEGYDAVSFRYLHFWGRHSAIAIDRRWYPHEVRAVRLNSQAQSWGDAQSFKNLTKVYFSEARIFHYGHVREAEKYVAKKIDILKLYHDDKEAAARFRKGLRREGERRLLAFWGSHPAVMKQRILRLGDPFEAPWRNDVWIVGKAADWPLEIVSKIRAKNVHWVGSPREIPHGELANSIALSHWGIRKKLAQWSGVNLAPVASVPAKMHSPNARPWTAQFWLTLKLSQKGIGVGRRGLMAIG